MKFGTNSGIFLPFSAFFGHFLWESRDISSFSENIREILTKFHQNFAEKWPNSLTKVGMKWNFISFHFTPAKKFDGFLLEFWGVSGAKAKKSCKARKMLKNEATLAIVAVDTGENEPLKVWGVSFHYFNRILRCMVELAVDALVRESLDLQSGRRIQRDRKRPGTPKSRKTA